MYVIEFGCFDNAGHRCNSVRAVTRELRKRGLDVKPGINCAASESVIDDIGASGAFSLRHWPAFSTDEIAGDVETFIAYGEQTKAEFDRFFKHLAPEDLIILNTASQNELWALAQWLDSKKFNFQPRVVANIFLPTYFDLDSGAVNTKGRLLRAATRKLRSQLPAGRLLYTTLTPELSSKIQEITGEDCLLTENPLDLSPFLSYANTRNGAGKTKIAAPGQAKAGKGALLLPQIVQAMSDQTDIVFCVQNWNRAEAAPANVEIVPQGLSEQEYQNYVGNCDVTLLPYQDSFYWYGVSAVFEEAVAAGHVIVTTENTWMGRHVASGQAHGSTISGQDVEAFSQALRSQVDNLAASEQRRIQLASDWVKTRGVEAYVDGILGHFPSQGS